jgi:hypothetical protein
VGYAVARNSTAMLECLSKDARGGGSSPAGSGGRRITQGSGFTHRLGRDALQPGVVRGVDLPGLDRSILRTKVRCDAVRYRVEFAR